MEPIGKKNTKRIDDTGIAEVLCSSGYLPPRGEQDLERFDRIYAGRTFETEGHQIDSDAMFDRVRDVSSAKTKRMRPKTNQSLLRAANSINTNSKGFNPDVFYQDINKKK